MGELRRPAWTSPERLLADQERVINKDGIHFESAIIAPELTGIGGRTVEVRYMPHDLRQIEGVH